MVQELAYGDYVQPLSMRKVNKRKYYEFSVSCRLAFSIFSDRKTGLRHAEIKLALDMDLFEPIKEKRRATV